MLSPGDPKLEMSHRKGTLPARRFIFYKMMWKQNEVLNRQRSWKDSLEKLREQTCTERTVLSRNRFLPI